MNNDHININGGQAGYKIRVSAFLKKESLSILVELYKSPILVQKLFCLFALSVQNLFCLFALSVQNLFCLFALSVQNLFCLFALSVQNLFCFFLIEIDNEGMRPIRVYLRTDCPLTHLQIIYPVCNDINF